MGITTPGNNTVLRSGKIDSISGIFSACILSSSSAESKGMKSLSSSIIGSKGILSESLKKIIVIGHYCGIQYTIIMPLVF